jgi:rare lipoprotein A (peptidoglycan hydrolase)
MPAMKSSCPGCIAATALALVTGVFLTSCGAARTAKRTVHSAAHGIGTVATLPLNLVGGLGSDRKLGKDDYNYTVKGRRYHVMSHSEARRYQETGLASYYGSEGGARTASGEHFNPSGMTAAHTTLPFNTQVRVTNLKNGKSVVLRINDRGPFSGHRIIDVSKGAATKLDFRGAGIVRVRVETVGG